VHFEKLLAPARARPVTAALIGAGEFGQSLLAQSRRMQGLRVVSVLDKNPQFTTEILKAAGHDARMVDSAAAARQAVGEGRIAVCQSLEDLLASGIEMIVEATGDPVYGARHAEAAIAAGIGVAMVSKEAECVVGPLLAAKARAADVPYTLVDGDQPALLISLVTWARALGLPIVAAGKSSEYDYVYDPATHEVTWTTERVTAPDIAGLWQLSADRRATLAARAVALAALPQRTVPDFCEMALVANATGLVPDRPDYHAPLVHTAELPEVYAPMADGGVLAGDGRLDVFNCLRRPDEASFAGGVFVVVRWADAKSGALFRGKGIPTSPDGRYGLVYNPSHLLGVEAPMSVLAAARLGNSSVDETYRPVVDLTARAAQDLPAGHRLEIVGLRHAVPGLDPLLTPAAPARGGNPLPYYMAVGRTLTRPVAAGEMLTVDCVTADESSPLWRLRREQDARFF
jgi:predicted homoserine dehydrogenase-like protein